MTIREKLELLKAIDRRNQQRRKEFAEKENRNRRLFELYMKDLITKEEFEERIKK